MPRNKADRAHPHTTTSLVATSTAYPLALHGALVVATGTTFTTLDLDSGTILGQQIAKDASGATVTIRDPIMVGSRIYVIDNNNRLLAYNSAN